MGNETPGLLPERHRKLLEARGFDSETLIRLGVAGSARLRGDCIAIPYFDLDGAVANTKYRTISGEKEFTQEKGGRQIFWNVEVIADPALANEPLIITEGEFDAISAIQAGFPRTVSVPCGAPAEEIGDKDTTKYDFIGLAPAALAEVSEILIAVDRDPPGDNLLADLALRLGRARCKWVPYPKGCKDLNDALQKHGVRAVQESIRRAKWIAVPGIYRMSDLPPIAEPTPYKLGLPVLDDHYRLRPGDLTVITGVPSSGKSTFINEIACRMAAQHGWPVMLASFEQMPQTDHRRALRTWFNRKRVIHQDDAERRAADDWIERMFSFVVPSEEGEATLAWVLERCSTAVARFGAKLLVIDPWNEIETDRPDGMSLTEHVGAALKDLRRFAKKHAVHVIVAAHPAKQRRLNNGTYATPSLYDISDSAHWYNRCDIGIVIHRDEKGTVVRVAKSRHHDQIGRPGDVPVAFNRETGRFEIADTDESGPAPSDEELPI